MPSSDILNKLNKQQQQAVINTEGPSVILAGAGSGKTRVLVYKVLYLILEKGVSPSNIMLTTFTNKAAGEMLERIKKALPTSKILPTVGTFHALCAKILRRNGHHNGIPNNFLIYDTENQRDTVKQAMKTLDIPIKSIRPHAVLATISKLKNEMITPNTYESFARGYFQEAVTKIYPLYQNILLQNHALDFDDLLLETIRLFRKNPDVLEIYQDKFRYILIDEYQDTNKPQYELTKLLAEKYKNVCVVGDFSQSIYSFRGADYRNLEKFKESFKEAKVFSLSQNYRSTQKILNAASKIISNNTTHPVLSLWTENSEGEDIIIFEAETEHTETEFILRKIEENMSDNPNSSYSDFAVLYRMNAQSRIIEEAFLHESIPYTLVGGTRFYERREVKDILSYLSHLSNNNDSVSLRRIEKIGKRKMQFFLNYEKKFNTHKWIENKNTIDILDEVIKETDYLSFYDANIPEDKSRIENIKELRSVAIEFPNLIQFLENVALVEQEQRPDGTVSTSPDKFLKNGKPNSVTLMTLHAAKGLEFKTVFIVGMEEGIFPHSQSFFDEKEVEEERRLCYVGITRAMEKLFLTYSKRRLIFGQRATNMMSRFIMELPREVLEKNMINLYGEEPF